MKYIDLDTSFKRSFLKSIDKAIDRQLYVYEVDVEIDFVNMDFVRKVNSRLEQVSNVKWKSVSFDFTEGELLLLVQRNVDSKRKRKKTDKQISYYKDMARALGENDEVPDDFLVFKKKLELLMERYNVEGPATEKQIEMLKTQWLEVFDEELIVCDGFTRKGVDDFFKLLKRYRREVKSMFEYLIEKRSFTIKLGQIIAHDIVQHGIGSFIGKSAYNLNRMDRYGLAIDALAKMPKNYLQGSYTQEQLLKDMAIYIDKRIPSAYAKWVAEEEYKAPSHIKASADKYGLLYQFEENYKK
ncbi:TPA: hypothetical protein ROY42_005635 [Bacillus thuringiensis]|nr:hypothetical protein [Bacillus thuringiensis]